MSPTTRMMLIWTVVFSMFSAIFQCFFLNYTLFDSKIKSIQDTVIRPHGIREDDSTIHIQCRTTDETRALPMIPSFIIIGVHKGGTTALYHILRDHPSLISSDKAETHFFDSIDFINTDGLAQNKKVLCKLREMYASLFPQHRLLEQGDATQPLVTFEKTPVYLLLPHLPQLVWLVCPWTRLVVSLRDPVSRFYSGYTGSEVIESTIEANVKDLREMGLTTAPLFSDYIKSPDLFTDNDFDLPKDLTHEDRNQLWNESESNGLYRGFYAQQLRNWIEFFPLESKLKVIDFDRFQQDKETVLDDVLGFVGAPAFGMPLNSSLLDANYSPRRPRTKNTEMKPLTVAYLKKFYRPYNEELYELLGDSWRGRWD